LEANELRRAKHGRVPCEHRVGEVVSLFQRVTNYGQKSLQVRLVRWVAIGMLQEVAQQAFRIGHRLLRGVFNAGRRTESALAEAIGLTRILLSALARNHGQVAKEQLVTGERPLI